MKLKTLIVDDEPLARGLIKEYAGIFPQLEIIGEASNGFQALEIIKKEKPHLIFLDIQMPEMTGFELLRQMDEIPYIIFSTAYDQYAIQAFEHSAVDYLLKPYTEERFAEAVEKVLKRREKDLSYYHSIDSLLTRINNEKRYKDRLLVKETGKISFIPVETIEYIQAMEDYVSIVTEKEGTHLTQITLTAIEKKLDPRYFAKIHRSYIVNLNIIREIKQDYPGKRSLYTFSGKKIPVSRSGYQLIKTLL